jgi:hypothetical protein
MNFLFPPGLTKNGFMLPRRRSMGTSPSPPEKSLIHFLDQILTRMRSLASNQRCATFLTQGCAACRKAHRINGNTAYEMARGHQPHGWLIPDMPVAGQLNKVPMIAEETGAQCHNLDVTHCPEVPEAPNLASRAVEK